MNVLPEWLRKWLRSPCAPTCRATPRARLALEALEDRVFPSVSPLAAPIGYSQWRQQTFTIDDTTVSPVVTTAATVTTQSTAPANNSFGSFIGLNQVFATSPDRGAGYSVAVIDTGINYNDPNLGGGFGKRVIAGYNFVNNTSDPMDDNGHGTFVASEIASSSPTLSGVAPGANLIALKVLDSNGSGSYGNVQNALDWVIAHRIQYNIVAINLSLGSGNYTTDPYTFLESDFATLRSAGVFTAVAAGNDYYTNSSTPGLAYPAVSSNVVSVGAVWDGSFGAVSWGNGARDYSTSPDKIASFSQRSSALSILAPGAILTADALKGGTTTMAGTSMASPVVVGASVLLHEALVDARLSADANQDYILQLMQSTGRVIVDGNYGTDNVGHTGLMFRRLDLGAAFAKLGVTGTGPAIGPITDQTVASGQAVSVTVSASGSAGPLSWQASAMTPAQAAYSLQQQLRLVYIGNYFTNADGMNEKWLFTAVGSLAVAILPDGTVRRYDPAGAAAMQSDADLLGRVDPAYYANPQLLTSATAPASTAPPASIAIAGSQLTVTPNASYAGPIYVLITATSGTVSAHRTFVIDVLGSGPVISPIADQSVRAGQSATVAVSASDNGTPVSVQAQAMTPAQDAYAVEQRLGLVYTGNTYFNQHGLYEKWLFTKVGSLAIAILPDGTVRRYDAAGNAAMLSDTDLLGRVDAAYYANPQLLTGINPPSSTAAPAAVAVWGSQLTITPNPSYSGPVFVQLTATSAGVTSRQTFVVVVTGSTGGIGPIADQTIHVGQSATLNVVATSAGGIHANWQARALTPAQDAYYLEQRLGLVYGGSYYTNLNGLNEKWLFTAVGSLGVCILPDGTVRRYDAAGNAAMLSDADLLGRVDPAFYANPLLLVNAAPTLSGYPATLSITGSQLTVTPSAGYVGSIYVQLTATDGTTTSYRTVIVVVS